MFENLCECIEHLIHPDVNEVLHTLNNANVCTDTQCFETMQDAGFGVLQTTNHQNHSPSEVITYFWLSAMIVFLIINRPTSLLREKPTQITNVRNRNNEIQ